MDPTACFSAEIVELIFKNFSGKELLLNSLVNKSWHENIGNIARCMDKIRLRMFGFVDRSVFSREYQHMTLWLCDSNEEFLDDIITFMESSKVWKTVCIENTDFPSTSKFLKLVKTFESTVQEFKLEGPKITCNDTDIEAISFPCLKFISLTKCDAILGTKFFTNVTSLVMIEVLRWKDFETNKNLIDLLMNQPKLKLLSLRQWLLLEDKYDVDFPFQLEALQIKECFNRHNSLSDFLTNQKQIAKLQLGYGADSVVLDKVLKMTSLKQLSLHDELQISDETLLTQSHSIVSLTVFSKYFGDQDIDEISSVFGNRSGNNFVKALLKYTPNVFDLTLTADVNEELVKFIGKDMKKLRRLYVKSTTIRNFRHLLSTTFYDIHDLWIIHDSHESKWKAWMCDTIHSRKKCIKNCGLFESQTFRQSGSGCSNSSNVYRSVGSSRYF